jgi:predicted dehydrogenase
MLDTEKPDVVSVVTPDHLHRPHAVRCLQAGCDVLLTKPLATNLADGRAIVATAERLGRKLMVAHERRYRARWREVKRLLEEGELGHVIHVRVDAIQDKRRQFERSPWYASAQAGRTALVGTGIHQVDLLRHLIGQPVQSAFAFSNRLGSLPFPADKTTAALFRFTDGAIGQVTTTYEAHRPPSTTEDSSFVLVASRGMIAGRQIVLDGNRSGLELPTDTRGIVAGSAGCVRGFLRAVVEDLPVPITGRDAFASLAACVAADRSAAEGRPLSPEVASF